MEINENGNEINNQQFLNLIDNTTLINAKEFIEVIKQEIKNGNVNPLQGLTVIKRMAKIAEEISKDEEIKESASKELDKHLTGNTKSIQLYGATICKAATYTFYDFSECNHPYYNELKSIQEQINNEVKRIEEELKLLIPSETKQANLTFGITGDTKDIIIESSIKLIIEPNGLIVNVKAPRKIQKIGIKFMKI